MNRIALEQPHVQVGAYRFLAERITDLSLRPAPLLEHHGITPEVLLDVDNLVPLTSIAALTTEAARVSDCPSFGLRVGVCGGLHTLGAIGEGMRRAETLGEALSTLCRSFLLYNRGACIELDQSDPDEAILRYIIDDPAVGAGEQVTDCRMAVLSNAIRRLCPAWRPSSVYLPRRQPLEPRAYANAFSAHRLRFDAPYASFRFQSKFLAKRIERTERLQLLVASVGDLAAVEISMVETVRQVCMRRLMAGRRISSDAVAKELGMARRTLYRRLATEGTSFQRFFDHARFGIAYRLLRDTEMPVGMIAIFLGYSEDSAFTRAFHNFTGHSPTAVRRAFP